MDNSNISFYGSHQVFIGPHARNINSILKAYRIMCRFF